MNDLVNFITNGSEDFTPAVMVGLIVFCVIFDGLSSLVGEIIRGVKR